MTEDQAQTQVEQWINPENRKWKEDGVMDAVTRDKAQLILNIPMSTEPREDEWKCPYDRRGGITSKSTYHFI